MYYEKELRALERAGRLRKRELYEERLTDFSSNDYLGLAHDKMLHRLTCQKIDQNTLHATKASLLVNGYHPIHKEFEDHLCRLNGFEEGVVVGSGFNANIALIEALVRKGDMLFMDEKYHASGVLATQIESVNVTFFEHNNMAQLREMLENSHAKRKIIAVEGIYSMDGDMVPREVFDLACEYDALLIVDEAHSSGVVGANLCGVYDHYGIAIEPNFIKMGTLGKAYGSFGAYILATSHIIEYLLNRAKPLIYATSLSLYDTALAHEALIYMSEHKESIKEQIALRRKAVEEELGIKSDSLIFPIHIGDNRAVMQIKEALAAEGFSVGAIREPTVPSAIIRLIARLEPSIEELRRACRLINEQSKRYEA